MNKTLTNEKAPAGLKPQVSAVQKSTRLYRVNLEYYIEADDEREAAEKGMRHFEDNVYPINIPTPTLVAHLENGHEFPCKGEYCEICELDRKPCGYDEVINYDN